MAVPPSVVPGTAKYGGIFLAVPEIWRHRLRRLREAQSIKIWRCQTTFRCPWRPINRRTSFLSFRMGLFLSLVCTLESMHLPYDFVISRCDAYPPMVKSSCSWTNERQPKEERKCKKRRVRQNAIRRMPRETEA